MREDAVAEPRDCRTWLFLLALLRCVPPGASVGPFFLSLLCPAGEKWGPGGRGGGRTHLVLLRTIFFNQVEGRCCRLCFMIFTEVQVP